MCTPGNGLEGPGDLRDSFNPGFRLACFPRTSLKVVDGSTRPKPWVRLRPSRTGSSWLMQAGVSSIYSGPGLERLGGVHQSAGIRFSVHITGPDLLRRDLCLASDRIRAASCFGAHSRGYRTRQNPAIDSAFGCRHGKVPRR